MARPTKEQVRAVIEEVDELDLPDGAYWGIINERLGLESWEAQEIVAEDPEFFGWEIRTAPEDPR